MLAEFVRGENVMKKEAFDKLLRDLQSKNEDVKFGYVTKDTVEYDNYYSNDEFKNFTDEMKEHYPKHFKKYWEGKGSEMKSYEVKGVQHPPKMASVASSSRFCYKALRDGAPHIKIDADVEFEYECPIKDKPNIQPQLDAFSAATNTYVEVKCHEIFDHSKQKTLGKFYADYIYGYHEGIGFNLGKEQKPDLEFAIPYAAFGLKSFPKHFDLKQFLCHLLGIACQNSGKNKEVTLVYLFFRPKTDDSIVEGELLELFSSLQKEIISVFTSPVIRTFCDEHKTSLKAYYEYADEPKELTPNNTHPLFI